MTLTYNPNSPGKKGVENTDQGVAQAVIGAPTACAELQWQVLATGAVDTVELFAGSGASAPLLDAHYNGLGRPMLVELVPTGQEASTVVSFEDFNVSAVTGSSTMFNEDLSQPITTSRVATSADGLFWAASALGATATCSFGTGAFPLTRQVLAVEIRSSINLTTGFRRLDPTGSPWTRNVPAFTTSFTTGSLRWGEAIVDGTDTAWTPWTPQRIRDFASGGTRKLRVSCQAGPGYWRMERLFMRVFYITERRRGVGLGIPSTSGVWVPFSLSTPNVTGAPSLTAGEQMSLICRRISDYDVDAVANATLPWRYLRGRMPTSQWRRHTQVWNPSTGFAAAGAQGDGIPCVRFKASGTVRADAMPYRDSYGARVYSGNNASQLITAGGGGTAYGRVFALAGWVPTVGKPAGNLRAEVYDSTGARVLNAVEVTPTEIDLLPVASPVSNVDELGAQYKVAQFLFPNPATLPADTYEVRLSSPGSTSARPWHVAALIGDAHTTDQTFGGTTQKATGTWVRSDGVVRQLTDATWSSDLEVVLADVPGPVTGVGAALGSLTAHHAEVCDPNALCAGCADDTMPYAQLTWTAAPSGNPDVVAYQIDRMDDLDPDWRRVAQVAGRTTVAWADHEVSIGVASHYRIRVQRTDGVVGLWSADIPITVPTGQVALALSSNAATGMGCVYPELFDGREVVRNWSFLAAGDTRLASIYGRNRQVAFMPLEDKGMAWSATLLMSALCSVARPTLGVFDPLRRLARAPIPYVCIRDGEGNRWYANIGVTGGQNRRADAQGTEMWTADLDVIEVGDRPAVADTSVPQVEGPFAL